MKLKVENLKSLERRRVTLSFGYRDQEKIRFILSGDEIFDIERKDNKECEWEELDTFQEWLTEDDIQDIITKLINLQK